MGVYETRAWMFRCGHCLKEVGPIFAEYQPALPGDWGERPRSGHPAVSGSMRTVMCPECLRKTEEREAA